MEALTVQVSDPNDLRMTLLIALEAARPDLSPAHRDYLREFALSIPDRSDPPLALEIDGDGATPLRLLSGYFRHTYTSYCLQEHLRAALLELMEPLQKGASHDQR